MAKRRPPLLVPMRRNTLTGLVAVSLAAVVSFPLFITLFLIPSFSHLMTGSAQREAERTAAHLAEPFFDAGGLVRPEQITLDFRASVGRHLRAFSLERLKVFAPSGEIVFSDDPTEEGKVNAKPYFREIVAAGRMHTSVVRRDGRTQEGRLERYDVVETYVPIMRGTRFVGAIEIYYDISARTAQVDRFLGRLKLLVFVIAGGLLAAVAATALRAERDLGERGRASAEPGEERERPG